MEGAVKAIVYERYGPPEVLEIREVATPTPKSSEVRIKTHATTVTSGDWRARSLAMPPGFGFMGRLFFGIARPRQPILGTELSGIVESAGKDVTRFKAGDAVFGFSGSAMGCHAEYKCMREDGAIALKPANLSFEQAAAISFGGTTALNFLRRGTVQHGEKVLVNGASGSVGTAAVQLARYLGADVTAVCSAANQELVQSLGADRVIDYNREDFTTNGEAYDVIIDIAGTAPYSRSRRALTPRGRLLVVLGGLADVLGAPFVNLRSRQKVIAGPAATRPEDLHFLARLAETGEFTPVIGRRYSFEQMVEAHRYVDSGHKRGNVVVTFVDPGL
jgi:NADPH:quinone reductase-like Zn-dependent oxidoreductase